MPFFFSQQCEGRGGGAPRVTLVSTHLVRLVSGGGYILAMNKYSNSKHFWIMCLMTSLWCFYFITTNRFTAHHCPTWLQLPPHTHVGSKAPRSYTIYMNTQILSTHILMRLIAAVSAAEETEGQHRGNYRQMEMTSGECRHQCRHQAIGWAYLW